MPLINSICLRDPDVIFFLVGMPKSGTTWLCRMLDTHPEIWCKGEAHLFDQMPFDLFTDFQRLWRDHEQRYPRWSYFDIDERDIVRMYRYCTDLYLLKAFSVSGKRICGDKSPGSEAFIERIDQLYPEAKIIHLVRDGRDGVVSWNSFLEEGRPLTEETVIAYGQRWQESVTLALSYTNLRTNYVITRYEELLESPEQELGQLFAFLGADTTANVVHECVIRNRFEVMRRDLPTMCRKGIRGDWRNNFDSRLKDAFKRVANHGLLALGYETQLDW
jgi:hypothetical protein